MQTQAISKYFLILVALPTLLVGFTALFDPQAIMGQVDVLLDNPSAKSSTRAIYGGMHLAFGLFFLIGAFKMQKEALWVLALYMVGFIVGRYMSLAVDGAPNSFIGTWVVIETALALGASWLLRKQYAA